MFEMSNFKFTKMQGTGNDFVMINGFEYQVNMTAELTEKICDRHFGIGGDGVIIILPPDNKENDYKMRIYNSDGSEAEMCGNGIRCFAHFLRENGMTNKKCLKIETLAGIIKPEIIQTEERESIIKVNMGVPKFKPTEIPVRVDMSYDYIREYKIGVKDKKISINCVSMGNPHSIVFVDDFKKYNPEEYGPLIEEHSIFPEKTNVEFIKIINREEIIMKVWERGTGITLACGTGATASVVAGIKNGILDNKVSVHLPGGDLAIEWNGKEAYMTGPAKTVFKGEMFI